MTERVIGYILLAVGVVVILLSAINVYKVFSGAARPIKLFDFAGIGINLPTPSGVPTEAVQVKGQSSRVELLSSNMINDTANLAAHLFLMGFLASIGYKLAALGILLLRPITVKVLDKDQLNVLK